VSVGDVLALRILVVYHKHLRTGAADGVISLIVILAILVHNPEMNVKRPGFRRFLSRERDCFLGRKTGA